MTERYIDDYFIGNNITIEGVKELLQAVQYQTTLANQLNRMVGIGLMRLSLQVCGIFMTSFSLLCNAI